MFSGKELKSFAALCWNVPVSFGTTSLTALVERSSRTQVCRSSFRYSGHSGKYMALKLDFRMLRSLLSLTGSHPTSRISF